MQPTAKELVNRISRHMAEAVRRAPAETDPFPHVIIPNFFPAALYDELLASLPEDSQYEAFDYEKHRAKTGASNRLRFRMHDDWLARLSARQRSFWYAVRQSLGSAELKTAAFEKLKAGLSFRFSVPAEKVNDIDGFALPELFREHSSYRIKPHPDTRRKIVTMQIGLAADDSQPDLGTEFYRRSLNPLHLAREPCGFEIVKRTPFFPNSAYAFSVLNNITWKSWHGRSTLPPNCGVRNTILNIWYSKLADANEDIYRQPARAAA